MTLVEMLIGALIFSSVTSGVYLLYTTMQNTMTHGELMTDLQQNARVGLAQIMQEIRMAGYDPPVGSPPQGVIPQVTLLPKAAIRAASRTCLSFVGDVTGSGTAGQITYDLSGTTLRRRFDAWSGSPSFAFSGGSAQPLVEGVRSLDFTYYDATSRVLPPAGWISTLRCPPVAGAPAQTVEQLTFEQMLRIYRVAITLKTQGSRTGLQPGSYTVTSDVRLRNQ
jgi:type II secretory pathway component PulJ